MKTSLVTVLTTTYNHSIFIANCIRGVLAQTYSNWEQVILDGGSTDFIGEIEKRFDDDRIVYVRQKLGGAHRRWKTCNHCLKFAVIITAAVGGGMIHKRKSDLQLDSFSDGVVLSYGKCLYIDEAGHVLGTWRLNGKQEEMCSPFCQDEQDIPSET